MSAVVAGRCCATCVNFRPAAAGPGGVCTAPRPEPGRVVIVAATTEVCKAWEPKGRVASR
jgi:hypothetical protein